MTTLRVARRILLISLHVLLGLVLTPLSLRRHAGGGLRTSPRITSWWHNRLADIFALQITVSGHRPQAPVLLASNHVSWLDIVVLGALTPTDFLSKDEVRRWPLIGWLAARSGTLFIRRGNGEAAKVGQQIAARLDGDGMLALFPEGTTTDGKDVRPFFSRLFSAALDTGTDVVPVTLRYHVDGTHDAVAPYTDQQTLLANLRGLIVRPRSAVHVTFGTPIRLDGHSRKEVAELARNAVVAALAAPLRPTLSG